MHPRKRVRRIQPRLRSRPRSVPVWRPVRSCDSAQPGTVSWRVRAVDGTAPCEWFSVARHVAPLTRPSGPDGDLDGGGGHGGAGDARRPGSENVRSGPQILGHHRERRLADRAQQAGAIEELHLGGAAGRRDTGGKPHVGWLPIDRAVQRAGENDAERRRVDRERGGGAGDRAGAVADNDR